MPPLPTVIEKVIETEQTQPDSEKYTIKYTQSVLSGITEGITDIVIKFKEDKKKK